MNTMPESRATFEQTKNAAEQSMSHNTGRWTGEEHNRFLQGLQQHGKVWKSIATVVKTRSIVQVRTHAQKYFMKMNRSDSPTPTSNSSISGSPPPMKGDKIPHSPSETSNISKVGDRMKNSQWKAPLGSSAPNCVAKTKSFGCVTTIPSAADFSYDKSFHYPRDGLHTVTTVDRPNSTKPRARKFDDIGGDHQKANSTKPKKPAKATKASKKKGSKAQANVAASLPYYGPPTAPGMSYSNSYPFLNDRQSDSGRKPYISKKTDGRNKRARLSKNSPKSRQTPSYSSQSVMDNYSMHTTPGLGDSPTHISQALSCPDFSYYQDNYSYDQMEPARIPSCESEADDSLDLENLLLKETLLSSGKKEWPLEADEFNLMKPEVPKMGLLDCGDLKLKVPGNEGFSLPQKESPTSITEPTWAALSYPDFVKEEKDLNLVPEYQDDQFKYDEDQLLWFGEDNIGDNIDDLFEKNDNLQLKV